MAESVMRIPPFLFRFRSGDAAIALDVKPKVPPRPMFCVINADTWAFHGLKNFRPRGRGDKKIIAQQVVPVELPVNLHRPAKQPRAGPALGNISHRLDGAQQNSGGVALGFRHHVHAKIHAINKINISIAWRPEHHFVPGCQTPGGVRRQIVRPQIRFRLDNPPDTLDAVVDVDQPFPEQITGDGDRFPIVKPTRELWQLLHGRIIARETAFVSPKPLLDF